MTRDLNELTIGLLQMSCGTDPRANLDTAIERIDEAASRGAQVVCTQELFRSQYFCQAEDTSRFELAESIPGPTTESLGEIARARRIVVIASLFEHRAPGVFHNTSVVIDQRGEITGRYRKMHIPDDPGYYEKFYFTPGDLDFVAHQTSAGRLGVLVCWDQWFPEAARLTALSGAQILFYPTAIGWSPDMQPATRSKILEAWRTIQRSHAIANGVFVAAINRTGTEGELEFWGSSFVADPFGEILAQASADRDETLVIKCDLNKIEETRRNWPFLRDRRIDAYADLNKRMRN